MPSEKDGVMIILSSPSGAGKSTMLALILKFITPNNGDIFIDDKNLKILNTKDIRKNIALVQQQPFLFSGKIIDAIRMGRSFTKEEVIESAKKSNAHHFIQQLPEKYETKITERGSNFSGGQIQRIAIARAILGNPSILLLDEATSALDAESESEVQEGLNRAMKNRTVIVIAHRLATTQKADKIVVFDKGEIIEVGKHIDLLNKYADNRNLNMKINFSKKKVFKKLKIKIKKEIVTMGVSEINPSQDNGTYIESTNWNKLIKNPNTIVIDTRNHYEVSIGTFQNSINPNTKNFSEFPKWVDEHLDTHLKNNESTNIAMFCTGGIRCEKATSLLKKKGYKNIYHLQGGILQYLDDISKEKNLFEGECYVFDKRVALDQELEKGSYSICHACGMPVSIQDQKRKEYIKGIQCHFCIDQFSDDDRKRFEERQKQIDRLKVENHKIYKD